jgi:signal transduction histidine kinase
MVFGDCLRAPRRLRLVFVSVMVLLTAALGGLGWRLLDQERTLALQSLAEQRDSAADLVTAALEKRLTALEQKLETAFLSPETAWPRTEGAILVRFGSDSIETWPPNKLIFYPKLPEKPDDSAGLFARADELEFRKNDHAGAIAEASAHARSQIPGIRAQALARIARNCAKAGKARESVETYARLAELGSVPVGEIPAALAAGLGILTQERDPASRATAAETLYRQIHSARWPISYATYQYLRAETISALPGPESLPPDIALAEAVRWLWERWSTGENPGVRSIRTSHDAILIVPRVSAAALKVFIADTKYIEQHWLADLKPILEGRHMRLALTSPDGRPFVGDAPVTGTRSAVRLAAATALPWNLEIISTDQGGSTWEVRRKLLFAGVALLLVLILIGSWFIGRVVTHELAVAQLQSDFVSAVSHEFRTPLTSLCQLSELLVRDRVATDEDRREYYKLLHNESHRLRRMVEALLNFGRLEANRMQFRFEAMNAAALVRQSAAEFEQRQQSRPCRIEVTAKAEHPLINADRDTLRCVLWNLLDNAFKYSPDSDTVWVDLANNGVIVEIAVRDRGIGIPRAEQRRIFERFVRGSAVRERGIGGTGIGLAMARQIVRAHGGDIIVESELAKGSTFRVQLPEAQS